MDEQRHRCLGLGSSFLLAASMTNVTTTNGTNATTKDCRDAQRITKGDEWSAIQHPYVLLCDASTNALASGGHIRILFKASGLSKPRMTVQRRLLHARPELNAPVRNVFSQIRSKNR
jgi:hypothetical protein